MRTLIWTLIILASGYAASAQAAGLSLREALVLGLGHNYDLQLAGLDVERSAAAVQGEEGRFDVTAELGLGVGHDRRPVDSAVIADNALTTNQASVEAALGKQFAIGLQARLGLTGERSDADSLADRLDPAYRTTLVLDFTQPLLKDLGRDINTARLRISRAAQQQAAYGYLASAQQLAAGIEQAYLDLAQAEADYRYAVLARDLAKELLDGNQRKFEAGLVPVTEVTGARSAVAGREEQMLLTRQRITQVRNLLLELIDHGETPLPQNWQATLPEVTGKEESGLDVALARGLQQRPDLQQARLELETRKIALIYADNQSLPRLDLEASLGINGLSGEADGNTYHDGRWQDSLNDEGRSWYAGLRFSMPLQNRAAKARLRDAAAQDKQSLYRLRRTEIATEAAIRSAYATMELGYERLEVARHSAELAQLTLDQENRRLEEGLTDSFRVLSYQNALVSARVSEVAALADYHRAWANLYQAMGANLERYNIVAALPHEGAMP